MAITAASYTFAASATEVLEVGVPASVSDEDKEIRHNGFNDSSNDVEGITDVAYFEVSLTAGAGSIDFTALPQPNGASLDATGKKVKLVKFIADAGNSGDMAIETGDSNGIDLGMEVTALAPGKFVGGLVDDVSVGAGAKVLDLTGTGTDKLKVIVWLGS
jgi:hypothetical protein